MKRVAYAALAALLVVVAALAVMLVPAFAGLAPPVDGPVAPRVQLVHDGYVNLYLVDVDGGVALIDCGGDLEAKVVLRALSARNLGPEAVKAIFLTHGHRDHTAGCARFPSAVVHAFEAERPLIEGTAARAHGPLTRFVQPDPAYANKVTKPLVDGETVLGVQAFLVPGHTPGSAAFLAHGVLFLGDSASGQADGKLRAPAWAFTDDVAMARASLARLEGRLAPEQVRWVACSHSGTVAYAPRALTGL